MTTVETLHEANYDELRLLTHLSYCNQKKKHEWKIVVSATVMGYDKQKI